jgi:hypothetical protein
MVMAKNETGFRVYGDGRLIATLAVNASSYLDDNPRRGSANTYGMEACNSAGASSRFTPQESDCQ